MAQLYTKDEIYERIIADPKNAALKGFDKNEVMRRILDENNTKTAALRALVKPDAAPAPVSLATPPAGAELGQGMIPGSKLQQDTQFDVANRSVSVPMGGVGAFSEGEMITDNIVNKAQLVNDLSIRYGVSQEEVHDNLKSYVARHNQDIGLAVQPPDLPAKALQAAMVGGLAYGGAAAWGAGRLLPFLFETGKQVAAYTALDQIVGIDKYKDKFPEWSHGAVETADFIMKGFLANKIVGGIRDIPLIKKYIRDVLDRKKLNKDSNLTDKIVDDVVDKAVNDGEIPLGEQEWFREAMQDSVSGVANMGAPPALGVAVGRGASQLKNTRGFIKTVRTSPQSGEQTKTIAKSLDQTYDTIPNEVFVAVANKQVAAMGIEAAEAKVLGDPVLSPESVAIGISLLKRYESLKMDDKIQLLMEALDSKARDLGRGVQLMKLWNSLTPQGFIRQLERQLKSYGGDIDKDYKKDLVKRMISINRLPDGDEKMLATNEVIMAVADKMPRLAKAEILLTGYRYNNMLSNPLTHARNIWGNMMQLFATKPLDMVGQWEYENTLGRVYNWTHHRDNPIAREVRLRDIGSWYSGILRTLPEAAEAFLTTFRSGKQTTKTMEFPSGPDLLESQIRGKLPKIFTYAGRGMEAMDSAFSIMLKTAEKARLMRGGMSDADADSVAGKFAEKYLFRERLGVTKENVEYKKTLPGLVRTIDLIGKELLDLRRVKNIGKGISWFIPFVTTSTNIAKEAIARSPFGFFGGSKSNEQLGKVFIGTQAFMFGASMANQDKVSWFAPTDPKQKEAWYRSGRLPLSFEVNGKWYPMWYLGPWSLAFMMPMALKHYNKDVKNALSVDEIEAVSAATLSSIKLITEQTALGGVKDLMDVMNGESSVQIKSLATPVGQLIPFEGLLRYVATVYDPIFRKSRTFKEELWKNIPGFTRDLPAYEKYENVPSRRKIADYITPYIINNMNKSADIEYKKLRFKAQIRYERMKKISQ